MNELSLRSISYKYVHVCDSVPKNVDCACAATVERRVLSLQALRSVSSVLRHWKTLQMGIADPASQLIGLFGDFSPRGEI